MQTWCETECEDSRRRRRTGAMTTDATSETSSATKRPARRSFPGAGGGSGRDPRAHEVVLRTALDLVRDHGYAKVTIDQISRQSGVPRSTIYRWWASKAEVIAEATTMLPVMTAAPRRASTTAELAAV